MGVEGIFAATVHGNDAAVRLYRRCELEMLSAKKGNSEVGKIACSEEAAVTASLLAELVKLGYRDDPHRLQTVF